MVISPFSTTDSSVRGATKTVLYGHSGVGKTTAIADYYNKWGKGLILSGEAGLKSLSNIEIDYLPFHSFNRSIKDRYSFVDLMRFVSSDEFKKREYKWLAVDSCTELSQRCFEDAEIETKDNPSNFELWNVYGANIRKTLKWIRDRDCHVICTFLADSQEDANGINKVMPMMTQAKIAKWIPSLFDYVFALVRTSDEEGGKTIVRRQIYTEGVKGCIGKARDPHRRLSPVENTDKVTDLLDRVMMTKDQFQTMQKKGASV